MPYADDHSLMSLKRFDVKWGTDLMGYCRDVNPQGIERLTRDKTVGQFGPLVLDRVHLGLTNPRITLNLQQFDPALIAILCPWATAGSPFWFNPPTVFYSEYANAKTLTLHPTDMGASTTYDIVAPKAFPDIKLPSANDEQSNFLILPCTFNLYPDQTALPNPKIISFGGLAS